MTEKSLSLKVKIGFRYLVNGCFINDNICCVLSGNISAFSAFSFIN